MTKPKEKLKEEFEKKFFIRRKSGLWINKDTFLIGNVWSWFDQKLKEEYKKGLAKGFDEGRRFERENA